MRSKCLLLVKIQIQNLTPKKKWGAKQIFLAAMYVVLLAMLASYSFGLAFGLGLIGMEEIVPGCAVMLPGIVIFFFTMLKANGVLFAYKDYEMLMSLPVPTRTVIESRFLLMYLFHLGMTAFVLVPMGIGYFLWAQKSAMAILMWIAGIFLVPLIPTAAATLVGAGIIFISARFRSANAVSTVLTVLFCMTVLTASFGSTAVIPEEGFTPEQIGTVSKMLADSIYQIYPPAKWFSVGVAETDLTAFLLFVALSVGVYLVFVVLVSKNYKKMNTGLMTHRTKGNYRVEKITAKHPVTAVCQKEARRFFGSAIYCVNMGIGVLMSLMLAVAAFFVSDADLERMIGMQIPEQMLRGSIPLIIGALIMMTCTTSVSLSLEGRSLWILKSLPITKEEIYKGKMLFNLLLQIPTALISSALLAVRFHFTGLALITLFAYPVAAAFAGTVWGLFINLKLPVYDWTNETTVVKQSAASLFALLFGIIVSIPFVGVTLLAGDFPVEILGAVETVLMILIAAGLWNYCRRVEF
ncbi:MAG: hypothetical protein KHZ72_01890 [Lachnospiraceae bacterium]|nr:hypothetical protein [Lachnospiraceae bacterium]